MLRYCITRMVGQEQKTLKEPPAGRTDTPSSDYACRSSADPMRQEKTGHQSRLQQSRFGERSSQKLSALTVNAESSTWDIAFPQRVTFFD